MSIDVACPGCGAEFTTDDEFAGQKTSCPECSHQIIIPGAKKAPQPASAPAPKTSRLELEDLPPAPPAQPSPPPKQQKPRTRKRPAPSAAARPAAQPPPAPSPAPTPAPAPTLASEDEGEATPLERRHRARARMAEYFRIALVILVALTMLEIFQVGVFAFMRRSPVTLSGLWEGAQTRAEALAAYRPALPAEPAPALEVGQMQGIALAILIAAMILLAVRLLLQAKMLDALYALSPHWNERTLAGVTFFFMANLALVGLLAWAASAAQMPEASDGMVGGLLGAWLIGSCFVAFVAHLSSGREFPHVTGRMINDGLFGLAIFAFLTFSAEIQAPVSRFAAVGLAVLLNSAIDFTLSSRFLLDNDRVGRFGRRLGFLLLSLLLIAALGYVCMALEAPALAAALAAG